VSSRSYWQAPPARGDAHAVGEQRQDDDQVGPGGVRESMSVGGHCPGSIPPRTLRLVLASCAVLAGGFLLSVTPALASAGEPPTIKDVSATENHRTWREAGSADQPRGLRNHVRSLDPVRTSPQRGELRAKRRR
jgi:hypothetical protein